MPRPYCCLIPRQREWNRRKNWPSRCWMDLAAQVEGYGLDVAFVSSREELRPFLRDPGLEPRDALRRSVDLLAHADFAIACESGGALLSLLCGCPTLVFGTPRSAKRVTQDENPLKTPVQYLARPDYDFSVEEVADAARDFMRDLQVAA